MKNIFLLIILIFIFVFSSFAQPNMKLVLPLGIDGDEEVQSVYLTKDKHYLYVKCSNNNYALDLVSKKEIPIDFFDNKKMRNLIKLNNTKINLVNDKFNLTLPKWEVYIPCLLEELKMMMVI